MWNDANLFQIDGDTAHVVLLRKGTYTTQTLPQGLTNKTSMVSVPVNDGEILAVPNVPFAVAGKANGQWNLHFFAPAGTAFDAFIFGPYQPSGTRVGMEVYNGSGQLIYDTGRLPLRVLGEVAGVGTFGGFPAGRRLALFPWTQYVSVERSHPAAGVGGGATYPPFMLVSLVTTGFVSSDYSGNVTIQQVEYFSDVSGPYDASRYPGGWDGTWSNNLQNKYSVIDVTGY